MLNQCLEEEAPEDLGVLEAAEQVQKHYLNSANGDIQTVLFLVVLKISDCEEYSPYYKEIGHQIAEQFQ